MGTPNLNLTIPTGGTTPGAANNTTAGTYPYEWSINLGLIDTNCLSIPNNPAKISNGGIVIDGNVNFGGFGITNASNASFSGTVGVSGTLTVTASATIGTTLGIGGAISETTASTALTLSGNSAATSGIGVVLNTGTVTQTSGKIASLQNNGTEKLAVTFAGGLSAPAFPDNTSLLSITDVHSNSMFTLQSTNGGSGPIFFGSAYPMQFNTTALSTTGYFGQATPSTAATVKGSAAGTGGTAVVLDNITTQTSGTIASFSTGGSSKATVDFSGTFFSGAAKYTTAAASTGVTVAGNAASSGTGVILDNAVDVTGTGFSALFKTAGTAEFAVTGRGHLIPLSTVPGFPTVSAGFGTITGSTNTGSDASFRFSFTSGTGALIAAGSLLFVVTLNQAYSAAAQANAIAAWASAPGGSALQVPLTAVFTAANTVTIYSTTGAFTPSSSAPYSVSLITMGAGATY